MWSVVGSVLTWASPLSTASKSDLLEFSEVVAGYGSARVLGGVNLLVTHGVTALLGVNGAGKSTLFGVLVGSVNLRAGEVIWNGCGVQPRENREFRSAIGWLPQSLSFPPRMRVHEVLRYAAWLKQISTQNLSAAIEQAVAVGDTAGLVNRRVGRLSGGELRRVALAASVVSSPPVVLLDEPTVGLDPLQRDRFHQMIRSIGEEASVLMATHLLEDVLAAAASVAVLHAGSIAFQGSVEELAGGTRSMAGLRRGFSQVVGASVPS